MAHKNKMKKEKWKIPKGWKAIPYPYWGYCDETERAQHYADVVKKGKNIYLAKKLCVRHLKRFMQHGY